MGNLTYLRRALMARFSTSRFKCPNCAEDPSVVVDRKFVITQLRRCGVCQMMLRTPTDDPRDNAAFYENEYSQGFTTDVPSDEELAEMKATNFVESDLSYAYYIGVLKEIGVKPGSRVFDYGCSWGYGSYQLKHAGFDVVAFEVAPGRRRRFASEKLGISTIDSMERAAIGMPIEFDCFFSAHVLEHVPSPRQSVDWAANLLKTGGLFVSFTPNGALSHRAASSNWRRLWGQSHPNFVDDAFFDRSFNLSPRIIGSSPAPARDCLHRPMVRLDKGNGWELFFAARKVGNAWAT